ncbi:hypothetical protein ACWGOQ_0017500 [Aquimarina sp. M1]
MKSSIIDIPKEINISNQKITQRELYNSIDKSSVHKDTIIKLYPKKEEEYIVIFSWHDRNKWKIDYPIQHSKIHKQRYVTHQQCLQLSEHIFNGDSLDDLKGFIDVPIRHFTLDEMLQFKKEDELMLRGADPDLHLIAPTPSQKLKISKPTKSNLAQKKSSKILGDISVPKEQPRTQSISKVTNKKKKKNSPLKQFKESTEELKKEKEQTKTSKVSAKPIIAKEVTKPNSTRDKKTNHTNLLRLRETTKPKKENKPSIVMGEQLGTDQSNTPTPPKPKSNSSSSKKSKPSGDDSFFSI